MIKTSTLLEWAISFYNPSQTLIGKDSVTFAPIAKAEISKELRMSQMWQMYQKVDMGEDLVNISIIDIFKAKLNVHNLKYNSNLA